VRVDGYVIEISARTYGKVLRAIPRSDCTGKEAFNRSTSVGWRMLDPYLN
jgi:hypothetical protein